MMARRTISRVAPARQEAHARRRRSEESGYAYLMALFMVLLVLVASSVVLENAVTLGRRAREDEMMWRGKQYTRAIKLYYRKSGHYPQNLDELEKGVGNVHFLRGPYPDPMNKNEDGKWRFIYTNASGAIIGSTRYATMQQMAILDLAGGVIPGAPGSDSNSQDASVTPVAQPDQSNCTTPVGGTTGSSDNTSGPAPGNGMPGVNPANPSPNPNLGQSPFGQNPAQPGEVNPNRAPSGAQAGCPQPDQNQQGGNGGFGFGGQGQNGIGQNGVGQFNPGQGQPGQIGGPGAAFGLTPQSLQALAQMKPTGPVDSPVIGGFLVGVGSTVDAKSQKVYKHAKNYKDWEFIWNPLEDQARAMQQGMGQAGMGGAGIGLGQSGSSGFGLPGSQANPTGPTSSSGMGSTPPPQPQQ